MLIRMVLRISSSKKWESKKRSKWTKPAHGLPRMPLIGVKFLNAMVAPYIGQ